MPINAAGAVAAPLTVFGSWVTDVSPDALPENVSPDCQEVVFQPGEVGSRPAFSKINGISCPPIGFVTPNWVGGKSFVTPTGDIKNLYFDSAGRLFVEDLSNSPGAITLILQSTPGSFYQSITKFGREYIALSDGLHGTEVPFQYDGKNLDRVTSDGPGAPPTIESVALPSVAMTAGGNTLVRNNNRVLAATAVPHNLKVGYQAQIANVPDSNSTTVNQTNQATVETANGSDWGLNSGQYRSLFNPGTSPLSAFVASGFGFNIPSGATILGVVISFGVNSQAATTGTVASVALWYSGAQEGTAKTPGTAINTTITPVSYGSAADLWSAALTPSIVNDPSFGFAISITCDSIRVFLNFPFTVQVYYTLSGPGTVAEIESIVIDNETHPGQALVTTTEPHGLAPDESVSIVGVEPANVANISGAQWVTGKTTLTTETNHNLLPGAVIQAAGITTAGSPASDFSFDGTWTVESVPAPDQLVYTQVPINASDDDVFNATANTGAISVAWPIPDDTPTPTYFEVDSCPTPTTFYIDVDYADGTWTTGTVGFIWEGIFYVTEVVDSTHFYYFQPGPNGSTSAIGTVTPFGQAAPGLHLCQVLWLTRQGAIPAPSPPVTVILNGGQYVQVTNLPIGPPYVIARILAFTGAQPDVPGELPPFFYIPVPAQLEGQVISTATVINDNTTTSALLDFSDNTLFAAIGISIPGNNLANQIVLDGALGFHAYLDRLMTVGQRNIIQNLLNLGFDGGYNANSPNIPLGWSINPTTTPSTGSLVDAHFGMAWQVLLQASTEEAGFLSQPAYLDPYGDPIFIGNQTYSIRFWAVSNGASYTSPPTMFVQLSSASTGFTSTAQVVLGNSTKGQWFEANFDTELPTNVPPDLIFSFWVGGASTTGYSVIIDDLQPIFAENPYLDNKSFASYVNNPEGMDGDTGQWGPDDTSKLMAMGIVRGVLNLLTQAPTGGLHETSGSATTEPSGWQVNPVRGQCGILSAFALTVSQADDATEAGGEEWMAWASDVGAMIYGGGQPGKISQEIQPNWNDTTAPNRVKQINMEAATTAWALNDPVARLIYFGLPINDVASAPSQIYVLNYQHLGSAEAIENSPPFHPSFGGKLIATDNARKWAPWKRSMNGAARMYRDSGELTTVFFAGNGEAPIIVNPGFGNAYTLNAAQFTDDDFGQIDPYYTTYFFLDPEKAQALGLKGGRLLMAFVLAQIQPQPGNTTSQATLNYFGDNLANPWPLSTTRILTPGFFKDRNFGGGMAQGERIAIQIASSPTSGTDNSFVCTRLTAFLRNAKLRISGVNQ